MSIILLKSFKLHLLIYLWICKYISLPKSFPAGQKMSLLHCQVHCQRNFPHSADGCENKLCTHVILHREAQTVGTRSRTLANNAGLVLVEIVLKWCKFLHKSPIIELPKHFNLQSAWGRLGQTSVSLSWQEADKFQFLCYEKVFWKHIKKKPSQAHSLIQAHCLCLHANGLFHMWWRKWQRTRVRWREKRWESCIRAMRIFLCLSEMLFVSPVATLH